MKKYFTKFNTKEEYDIAYDEGNIDFPNVSVANGKIIPKKMNYHQEYLTFEIVKAGSVGIYDNTGLELNPIYYSIDNGETWNELVFTTDSDFASFGNFKPGDTVKVKANNESYYKNSWEPDGIHFVGTANYNVYGNIASILLGDDFKTTNYNTYNIRENPIPNIFASYGYISSDGLKKLSLKSNIISAKNLILPFINLSNNCYYGMFNSCESLIIPPELPATTLADSCYMYMFYGCTSLTTPPELPATTLAFRCYVEMFKNCISLTIAPELPATTLAYACYSSMFYGCTSLTTAPELPATTLAEQCYVEMFKNCISLTIAPELPATALATNCYREMFEGCTSLNYAKALFISYDNINNVNWILEWLPELSENNPGIFICNNNRGWNVTIYASVRRPIPYGWVIFNEDGDEILGPYAVDE